MKAEFDGSIGGIGGLHCSANLEIQFSVITEEHYWGNVEFHWKNESDDEFHLRVDAFAKYLGDEDYSEIPVIKYSTKDNAPAYRDELRLRPVNYFRKLPAESRGVGDALEGCRSPHQMGPGSEMTITNEEDGTSLRMNLAGANITDDCHKTFMYCCSFYDSNHVLSRESARRAFAQDYSHGSIFLSSKQLADRIIESFAATLGQELMESGKVPKGYSATYVWIVYGPVKYLADPPQGLHGIDSFFTKPAEKIYRNQNEYRFWLGMLHGQAQSDNATIDLPVPSGFGTGVELS